MGIRRGRARDGMTNVHTGGDISTPTLIHPPPPPPPLRHSNTQPAGAHDGLINRAISHGVIFDIRLLPTVVEMKMTL